jgi:hypothetical protein
MASATIGLAELIQVPIGGLLPAARNNCLNAFMLTPRAAWAAATHGSLRPSDSRAGYSCTFR